MSLPKPTRTRTWWSPAPPPGSARAGLRPGRTGHNVVLVARRKERLEELAERLRTEHRVRVTCYARDLGSVGEREALGPICGPPGGW